jgi:bifunctional DNase/RNase
MKIVWNQYLKYCSLNFSMPRKKKFPIIFATMGFLIGVIAGLAVIAAVWLGPEQLLTQKSDKYFTPTSDLVLVNVIKVDGNKVTIGKDCTAIVATTSPERAEAIATGLANKTPERPTIYDSFATFLQTYNITLEAVVMHKFESDVYFSDAYFLKDSQVLQLDMKPSDAIALALRTHSPVYINNALLQKMGENICRE